MFLTAKLNLAYLNKAAKRGGGKKMIRIPDLEMNRFHVIKNIREIKTKNGNKIVIDMVNDNFFLYQMIQVSG